MEVYSLSNWMIKAGHYDKNIKDLATLDEVPLEGKLKILINTEIQN